MYYYLLFIGICIISLYKPMSELKYIHSTTQIWIYLIHAKIFSNLWVCYHVWTLKSQTTDKVLFFQRPSKSVRSLQCKVLTLSECGIPRETTSTAVGDIRLKIRQTTVVGHDRLWIRQHIGTGISDMAILRIMTMCMECSIVSSPPGNPDT